MRGGLITGLTQFVKFTAQLGSAMVLARLLQPSDFGLVGIVASAVAILGPVRDAGITNAIISGREPEPKLLNSLFIATVFLGGGLFVAACGIGFGAMVFVSDKAVLWVAAWHGVAMLLNSLELVPYALMRRSLSFGRVAWRDVVSLLVGIGIAIGMAIGGLGWLSLIGMLIGQSATALVLTWRAVTWRPGMAFASWAELRDHIRLAGAMTASDLAQYFTQNIDTLIIGGRWGTDAVGNYSRAQALTLVPAGQLIAPLGSVIYPILTRLRDDETRYTRWAQLLLVASMAVAVPLATGLSVTAPEIVRFVLGPGWAAAIPLFSLLALSIAVRPIGALAYWIMLSSGQARPLMLWAALNCCVTVAIVIAAARWGATGVALSVTVGAVLLRVPLALLFATFSKGLPAASLILPYSLQIAGFGAGAWALSLLADALRHAGLHDILVLAAIAGCCGVWLIALVCISSDLRALARDCVDSIIRRAIPHPPGSGC
jgi:O-antigen/teichoic acid export membrane protein